MSFRTFALVLALGSSSAAYGSSTEAASVDESIVLRVGDLSVTQYLVDKRFNAYCDDHLRRHGVKPDAAEIEQWFGGLFVDLFAVSAAERAGYLNHPAVVRTVARMARYTLTREDSPVYGQLDRSSAMRRELLATYAESHGRAKEVAIVRFRDEQTMTRLVGAAADGVTIEQFRALPQSELGIAYELFDGAMVWPYHPFEDIVGDLRRAQPGRWTGPLVRDLGVYFFMVRGEKQLSVKTETGDAGALERVVDELARSVDRRRHEREVLRQSEFTLVMENLEGMGELLVSQLRRLETGGTGEATVPGNPVLARYVIDGETTDVTARDFLEWYANQVIRKQITNVSMLAGAIRQMVAAEQTYRIALAAGLDRAPKFVQDRQNFTWLQALEWFQKERVVPELTVTDVERRMYFEANRERYAEPGYGVLQVYVFEDPAEAGAAAAMIRKAMAGGVPSFEHSSRERVVIQRADAERFPEVPNLVLLSLADGEVIGPIKRPNGWTLIVKERSGPRTTPSFQELQERVHADLVAGKIEEWKRDYFSRNEGMSLIECSIDWGRYGIDGLLPPDME